MSNHIPFHIWKRLMEEPPRPGRAGSWTCKYPELHRKEWCHICRDYHLCNHNDTDEKENQNAKPTP